MGSSTSVAVCAYRGRWLPLLVLVLLTLLMVVNLFIFIRRSWCLSGQSLYMTNSLEEPEEKKDDTADGFPIAPDAVPGQGQSTSSKPEQPEDIIYPDGKCKKCGKPIDDHEWTGTLLRDRYPVCKGA